ncbi:MAG: small subunit ribosomal protein S9, partial [Parcubacteria group bacterium Gr01-1014_106]
MTSGARYVEGIGRRKTAVARVRLFPSGSLTGGNENTAPTILVNQRSWQEYFPVVSMQTPIRKPFEMTGTWGKFDVSVHVSGGGVHAQAEALRHGLARCL